MWPFRRRAKAGKHLRGAPVSNPSVRTPMPVAMPVPMPVPIPARSVMGRRVELGFRDGSTAALAPGSDEAKALCEITAVLLQRSARDS